MLHFCCTTVVCGDTSRALASRRGFAGLLVFMSDGSGTRCLRDHRQVSRPTAAQVAGEPQIPEALIVWLALEAEPRCPPECEVCTGARSLERRHQGRAWQWCLARYGGRDSQCGQSPKGARGCCAGIREGARGLVLLPLAPRSLVTARRWPVQRWPRACCTAPASVVPVAQRLGGLCARMWCDVILRMGGFSTPSDSSPPASALGGVAGGGRPTQGIIPTSSGPPGICAQSLKRGPQMVPAGLALWEPMPEA